MGYTAVFSTYTPHTHTHHTHTTHSSSSIYKHLYILPLNLIIPLLHLQVKEVNGVAMKPDGDESIPDTSVTEVPAASLEGSIFEKTLF